MAVLGKTDINGGLNVNGPVKQTGNLIISNTGDASQSTLNAGLIIGATDGTHVMIDGNEVMAANNKSTSTLYLNDGGGQVQIGSGGLNVTGTIKQNNVSVSLSTHDHDGTYVKTTGDTMSGPLTFTTKGNISFKGTKTTYPMIKFIDNAGDSYGNGISIGGGGLSIIGGGESSDTIAANVGSGGTESLYMGSDGNAYVITNLQNGYSDGKIFTFGSSGSLTANSFIKKDGKDTELLLANGTVKAISDFATSGHDHNTAYFQKKTDGSYMGHADSWVRSGASGFLPQLSGGSGNGHCNLGTSGWYWKYAYIDNVYSSYVTGAVWNDLVDKIIVSEGTELEYGKCYYTNGKEYKQTNRYCQRGVIGIHSDTFGFSMGNVENKTQLNVSVAGFVLAFTDKKYKSGTPLTCTKNGYLTKISLWDKIMYPERIVGTYWKDETQSEWNGIKVNNRNWIKIE